MSPHRSRPSRLGRVITRYVGLKTALGRGFDGERRVLQALDSFLRTDGSRAADLTPESLSRWTQTQTHVSPTVRRPAGSPPDGSLPSRRPPPCQAPSGGDCPPGALVRRARQSDTGARP
jgi:hypothetical protein